MMEEFWQSLGWLVVFIGIVVLIIQVVRSPLVARAPGAGTVRRVGARAGAAAANAPGAAIVLGWPRAIRLFLVFVLLALALGAALAFLASFGTGDTFLARLNSGYELLWSNTIGLLRDKPAALRKYGASVKRGVMLLGPAATTDPMKYPTPPRKVMAKKKTVTPQGPSLRSMSDMN